MAVGLTVRLPVRVDPPGDGSRGRVGDREFPTLSRPGCDLGCGLTGDHREMPGGGYGLSVHIGSVAADRGSVGKGERPGCQAGELNLDRVRVDWGWPEIDLLAAGSADGARRANGGDVLTAGGAAQHAGRVRGAAREQRQ